MTPHQKAKEIFSKFYSVNCNIVDSIDCANYMVDNIIEVATNAIEWWQEVKRIINDHKELAKLM